MPAAVRASPVVMTNAMGDNAGNSPKRECIISSFGIVRTPTAKLVVKRSPTKASPGSVVCPSSHQTITAAASKNTKTPQNGSSAYSKASAIPGSATWESASPTRAIRFKIINPPIAPDAIPTAAAMIRDAKGGKFTDGAFPVDVGRTRLRQIVSPNLEGATRPVAFRDTTSADSSTRLDPHSGKQC